MEMLHRTWVEVLIGRNHQELAALILDGELEPIYAEEGWLRGYNIELPKESYHIMMNNQQFYKPLRSSLIYVCVGYDGDGDIELNLRIKPTDVDENWREQIRKLIIESKDSNQGIVTEKVFQ